MILSIFDKYKRFLRSKHQILLVKGFSLFVNANPVTFNNPNKTAEYLSKYCDQLLKKSNKMYEDVELEEILDKIVDIFRYIEEKDAFQIIYIRLLGKRLIDQLSVTDDAELYMITKFKEMCGYEYTYKIQRMFQVKRFYLK